ncbi:MAG: hypothetical protein ACR2M4_06320 [Actinomycetota bacterium]
MSNPFQTFNAENPPLQRFPQQDPRQKSLKGWLLAISFGLAALNFLLNPIIEQPIRPFEAGKCWGFFCIGSMGGQAGILAIAAVMGPSSALRRHLYVVPRFLSFVMAWLLGFMVSHAIHRDNFPPLKIVVGVLLVLPLLFCVCELPLWIFRTFLRWRIESPLDENTRPPQLSIAGILAATAAVGISLGAVRLGQKLSGISNEAEWWLGVAIAAAWCGGICVLVLPVVTAMVFRTQSLVVGLLVSVAWIGLLITVLQIVVSSLVGGIPSSELRLFGFMGLGFTITLLGPLFLVRHYGYRLRWGRSLN